MIALIDYGAGNLTSVKKALAALGTEFTVPETPALCEEASALIVPGVGHFSATMALDEPWRRAIGRAVDAGTPLLGICVGMQLLFEASEEGPVGDGVGVVPGKIRYLTGPVKIPHIGWDEVTVRPGSRLFAGLGDGTRFYFVHSYAPEPEGEAVAAVCDYGGRFAAAVEHGNLFGTQFHPEKSGGAGLALLANFVSEVRAA